jgi:signal transduction histidine kinase/CheY-like chemotaxis protein
MDTGGPGLWSSGVAWPVVFAVLLGGLLLGGLAGWWLRSRRPAAGDGEEAESLRQRLQRAQRMEALGILSGSIMHNLNNLLSVVLGQARLARDDVPADAPARASLEQVIRAGEAAAQLSREVDSYQSEADHARKPVRLQPVVRSTVKLLRDILPGTVEIVTDLDSGCGPVLASTTQVQQILMSLCSNAYHAMYRRHGRITVSMVQTEIEVPRPAVPHELAPGVYIRLSVADNGRGMDAETLGHIFEPYFSARAPQHGAGLGLTMVSRLLTANEGVTIPSSLPGHGTRFDLYFPLIARGLRPRKPGPARPEVVSEPVAPAAAAEEPAEAAAEAAAASGAEPAREGPRPPAGPAGPAPAAGDPDVAGEPTSAPRRGTSRPAHILLVEDDTMVAETVRSCLKRAGLEVTLYEDGAAAVAAFRADPGTYDLLLTDQFMQGLDGREVVAEVRRQRPRLPVILMSGHPEGIRPDDVVRLRVADTLAKPFSPARLLDAVRRALAEEGPRAQEGEA